MQVRLYEFYADWCGPCDRQEEILEELEENNEELAVTRVDVDEEPDVASSHNVRSLPTLLVAEEDEDGEVTEVHDRFVGVTQEEDLAEALETARMSSE